MQLWLSIVTCPLRTTAIPSRAEFIHTEKTYRDSPCKEGQSSGFGYKNMTLLCWTGHQIPRHIPITPPYPSHQVFTGSHIWAQLHSMSLLGETLWISRCLIKHLRKGKQFCWVKDKRCRKQNFKKKKERKKKTVSTSSDYLELYMFTAMYNWQKVARISSSWLGQKYKISYANWPKKEMNSERLLKKHILNLPGRLKEKSSL